MFDGPLLTHDEVLALGDEQAYTVQIGPRPVHRHDARPAGTPTTRASPNAGVVGRPGAGGPRDIAAGEEIQFDYSTTMSENHWTMECRCGRSRSAGG